MTFIGYAAFYTPLTYQRFSRRRTRKNV